MRAETQTSAEHRENIRRMATESLAHHQVAFVGDAGDTKVYRFARPDSGFYAVRILVWPGWIVVAGDAGDTLFRHSDLDSLAWLRGSVSDVRYMLGKVQGARRIFSIGDALAFMRGEIVERAAEEPPSLPIRADLHRERLAMLQEWVESAESLEADAPDFYAACREAEIDDPPDCLEWDSDHVWAVEILRHFVKALDAKTETKASRDRSLASRAACPSCFAAPLGPCATGGIEEPGGTFHVSRTTFGIELQTLCGCGPINLTGEPHKDACPARDGGVALLAQRSSENDDLGARVLSAVREWFAEAKPRAPESIYQMDRVVESLPSLAERVCGVVGYYSDPNEASVTQDQPKRFYLRSNMCGDCALFWKLGDHGYTADLDQAQLYSKEDAESRVRPGVDELVPETIAILSSRRHVSVELLP